ncbi:MAG: hydrogenase expression/formation protein HypE [Desulfobacteraceae bacterium 4572_130]|nr:MAG: hydrogenase expression/formation protein HypE [Desulfobacteraceae bacterium 4572_130]
MKQNKILLEHGSGGKISNSMISKMIIPIFDNSILAKLNDGAELNIKGQRLAFSTDSYVADPIFFKGGNIGDLAVNGTINDISMCGAEPLYLSAGLILEEGFLLSDLEKILKTMAKAANKAGVKIVTGDTKVVPRGNADKIFINTSGIGIIPEKVNVSGDNAKVGDKIIISGTIADHGITIISSRKGLEFDSDIKTDSASLNKMVKDMLAISNNVHVLRDPTRGGLGTTLNEIAFQSNVGIRINEEFLPINKQVLGICELLGFDPIYIANEGKLLAFVSCDDADKILKVIRQNEFGKHAAIIGEVVCDNPGKVFLNTTIGGTRIIDMMIGEQVPRIC